RGRLPAEGRRPRPQVAQQLPHRPPDAGAGDRRRPVDDLPRGDQAGIALACIALRLQSGYGRWRTRRSRAPVKGPPVQDLESHLKDVVDQHGPWTAMAIKLPGGAYTREPAVDHRLKRILQVCGDIVGKPLSQCRVLDLACLEGHYTL